MPETENSFDLLERTQVFQERLMDIGSLDDLINLACTILDCSLFICDGQGYILASSPTDCRTCASFRNTVENTRQLDKDRLKPMLGPNPLCNVIRDPGCAGDPCVRLSFPLKIGEQGLPGAITFFIWDRSITQNDQALASMIAGAFAVFMRKRFTFTSTTQARRIGLLRELMDYKPGLRSYYERALSMEGLSAQADTFRLAVVYLDDDQKENAGPYAMELQYHLPSAWIFPYKDTLIAVFTSSDPDDALSQFTVFLRQHGFSACLSAEFSSLLELRYVYEDTQVCLSIAMRKTGGECLYRAERYLDLAFLHKCRQYFPLDQYYLEGFSRLHDYDEENGKGYLTTLTAYLDNNMSVSAAAKAIFMHRNTITQQLDKIEELLGISLKDKEMCWYLQLCLRIHELLEM